MKASWLADVLRAARVPVVEMSNWKNRGNGELNIVEAVVWHHDGSPEGASPNVPTYIKGQVEAGHAGANVWVSLDGTWWLIAAGMTYHAGAVLDGKPGNSRSIGIETDHTTGETWSGVELLASLRKGTAAILNHLAKSPAIGLEFHKTVCKPVGRKNDPDGLDISTERAEVALLMSQGDDEVTEADLMRIIDGVADEVIKRLSEDTPTSKASDRLKKAAHFAAELGARQNPPIT